MFCIFGAMLPLLRAHALWESLGPQRPSRRRHGCDLKVLSPSHVGITYGGFRTFLDPSPGGAELIGQGVPGILEKELINFIFQSGL